MNDEIKEILEIFKQVDLEPEAGGCYNCPKKDKDKTCIGCLNNAKDKLLDYITNLQQKNERLKEGYCELKVKCNNGECDCTNEEYEGMIQANMKGYLLLEDYKSRIEKAIRLIEEYHYFVFTKDIETIYKNANKEFINILRGKDNE